MVLIAACGDGAGPIPTPDPQNPAPAIIGLEPDRVLQFSDSLPVRVTGTGFVAGAVVRLDGTTLPTTYLSPFQVAAVVPAARMQESGALQVTVLNPAPGGGESGAVALPVEHRVPELQFLSGTGVGVGGSAPFPLRVHGSGFARGSVVRWDGNDRPTTFVDQHQLTFQIPASDQVHAALVPITVFSPAPGGGTSAPRIFRLINPQPIVDSVSPDSIFVETDTTFTIYGGGLVPMSQSWLGPARLVAPGQLRVTVAASTIGQPGVFPVTVQNPPPVTPSHDGGASFRVLWILNRVPVLTALSPAHAQTPVGEDRLVLRLTGTGFVDATKIAVGGVTRLTRRISRTELEVVLCCVQAGTLTVRAENGPPGGGVSNELTLELVDPPPAAP
jgi:hypothetical protein